MRCLANLPAVTSTIPVAGGVCNGAPHRLWTRWAQTKKSYRLPTCGAKSVDNSGAECAPTLWDVGPVRATERTR